MYLKKLLPVVALCLLFGGQSIIVTSQAYAFCCRCGAQCRGGCTCPGTDPACPWCAAPDPAGDPIAQSAIRGVNQPLESRRSNSEVNESFLLLMRLGNSAVKPFHNVYGDLPLACPTPDGTS